MKGRLELLAMHCRDSELHHRMQWRSLMPRNNSGHGEKTIPQSHSKQSPANFLGNCGLVTTITFCQRLRCVFVCPCMTLGADIWMPRDWFVYIINVFSNNPFQNNSCYFIKKHADDPPSSRSSLKALSRVQLQSYNSNYRKDPMCICALSINLNNVQIKSVTPWC